MKDVLDLNTEIIEVDSNARHQSWFPGEALEPPTSSLEGTDKRAR